MKIHKEGFGIITIAVIVYLSLLGLAFLSQEKLFLLYLFITITPVLYLIIRFFRFPERELINEPDKVFAPADGVIVAIEETNENEYFKDKRLQVSVFMNINNVHINWIPVPGKIKYARHHNGRFMAAYLPKSSTENERASTVIETEDGTEILVRQVAGAMAKRIVTYPKEGELCQQNEQLGFIKFGSRVDVFLPVGTKINVEMGEHTTGSQTILAEMK